MCNLYSITRSQDAMRRLFAIERDLAGNLPPLPGVFPDMPAPIVRVGDDGMRELAIARWVCPARRSSEARRSPTSETLEARIGGDGSVLRPAASFR